jgi:hypothetical protein
VFVAVDHVVSRVNAAAGLRPLAMRELGYRGRASPSSRAEPSLPSASPGYPRRPCQSRAISGHERYPAVSHGHSERPVRLVARL